MRLTLRVLCGSTLPIVMLALAPQLRLAAAIPKDAAALEQEQIKILQSNAKPGDKGLACKRLAVYGTKNAVPSLAPLLADPQLASWARIAFEAIPGPEADAALRDAAGKLQGRLLVGAINSLGVRRDGQAFALLEARLKDPDADVAAAAAAALGAIGGERAAKVLSPLLTSAPAPRRSAVAEACIVCAEGLLDAGKAPAATQLYDAVKAAGISPPRTIEATRGAIIARGAQGVPLLAELLRSHDKTMFGVGLRVAREVTTKDVTRVLVDEFKRSGPDRQIKLLLALADRRDAEALGAAIEAAGSDDRSLRLVAVRILDKLADPAAIPVLLVAAVADDGELALAGKSALTRLPGATVDAAVVALLGDSDPARRELGIDLLSKRQMDGAVPLLLKAARDGEPKVRQAALKAAARVAGQDELPALLEMLLRCTSSADIRAAESAVTSACTRSAAPAGGRVAILKALYGDLPGGKSANVTKKVAKMVKSGALDIEASNANFGDPVGGVVKKLRIDYTIDGQKRSQTVLEKETLTIATVVVPPACVDAVCAALAKAPTEPKLALLRVLRSTGTPKALEAVRTAAADADTAVRDTALRALCDWPSAAVLPDLLKLARTSSDNTVRILAARGYIRLVDEQGGDATQKLAALKEILPLVKRADEKKRVLAACGGIPTLESLAVIVPFLDDSALKEEASAAAVAVAEQIPKPRPAEVKSAAQKVCQVSANRQLTARAKALLRK